MCVDYTSLNKAYPKDPFPLSLIVQVIDLTAGCELLSFLGAYSRRRWLIQGIKVHANTPMISRPKDSPPGPPSGWFGPTPSPNKER
jgi:hypothetical protein